MCGFVGVLDLTHQRTIQREIIEGMMQTIVHRGPDSYGYHYSNNTALGFRRLKIVDLVTGDQPLCSDDGSIVLVCHGEIYNHTELRATLKDNSIKFKTHSDVEVLIYLYRELGIEFINKLNGQFAFALLDKKKNQLYLVRDQFGICPLFYTVIDNYLIFASEIKAILQHPSVTKQVNLTGLDQIFTFPGMISPTTLFKNIDSLPAGHVLKVNKGKVSSNQYWDLTIQQEITGNVSDREYIEEMKCLLDRSIKLRLQADVPVGFYLSGGLDSSLLLTRGERLSSKKVDSFSVTFPGKVEDESEYQKIVLQNLKVNHHELAFQPEKSLSEFSSMIYHSECAVKESYNLCSMDMSHLVKDRGVSVVLSGEGADELFAGYAGYKFDNLNTGCNNLGWMEQSFEEEIRMDLWGDNEFFYEKNYHSLGELKSALYSRGVRDSYFDFKCIKSGIIDRAHIKNWDALSKRSYIDFKLRLVDHLVSDHGDRMGMANSVEIRYPFLDLDLVEFSTRLPAHLKMRNGIEKYIIKEASRNVLPESITTREKYGFRAPGSTYWLQHNTEWVNDMLSSQTIAKQGYFSSKSIANLQHQYQNPNFKLRTPYEDDLLMIVLSFGVFLDTFDMPDFS